MCPTESYFNSSDDFVCPTESYLNSSDDFVCPTESYLNSSQDPDPRIPGLGIPGSQNWDPGVPGSQGSQDPRIQIPVPRIPGSRSQDPKEPRIRIPGSLDPRDSRIQIPGSRDPGNHAVRHAAWPLLSKIVRVHDTSIALSVSKRHVLYGKSGIGTPNTAGAGSVDAVSFIDTMRRQRYVSAA